jgi:hypothetical protein
VAAAAAGEEARVFGRSAPSAPSVPSVPPVRRDRPWWLALLLRGPGVYPSLLVRAVITLVIAAGAVCVLGSGVIHLYLWGKQFGYRSIPTIGPLFLIQGIGCLLIGLLTLITRRLAMVLVAAGTMVASFCALIIAVEVGLFGWQDSWSAAYALTALYEEIAGAVLLLAAAVALAWNPRGDLARPGRSGSAATQGRHRAAGESRVSGL